MNKTQKGFALVESLLILIIVLLVGFIGYYVWHTKSQTNKTLDTAASTNQTAQTTSLQKSSHGFLDITQLGMKLPTPTSVSDLRYIWHGQSAELYSDSLTNYLKSIDPICNPSDFRIAEISTYDPRGPSWAQVEVNSKKYEYAGPQQGCSLDDKGGQASNDRVESVEADMTQAFSKSVAD